MPTVSIDSADKVKDWGPVLEHTSALDGYTVSFVTFREDSDITDILAGLSQGKCICPHWGYLFEGSMTVRYGDHEETYGPGDAFYMPPGHTPKASAGTRFVQFSPAEELAVTEAAIAAAMA